MQQITSWQTLSEWSSVNKRVGRGRKCFTECQFLVSFCHFLQQLPPQHQPAQRTSMMICDLNDGKQEFILKKKSFILAFLIKWLYQFIIVKLIQQGPRYTDFFLSLSSDTSISGIKCNIFLHLTLPASWMPTSLTYTSFKQTSFLVLCCLMQENHQDVIEGSFF